MYFGKTTRTGLKPLKYKKIRSFTRYRMSEKENLQPHAGLGERIKEKRVELGLSREQFADELGITVRFLFDVEAGKKGLSLNRFFKIRNVLGVSADWLWDG